MRKLIYAALAGAMLIMGAGAAQAQSYNQVQTSVQGGGSPAPGKTVTLTVSDMGPGTTVTFKVFSDPIVLGTAVANSQGVATGTFTIPSNLPAGTHHIEASGVDAAGNPRTVSTGTFTVSSVLGATLDRPSGLTRTGSSNTVPMALGGVALVGAGAGLVIIARRRRAVPAAA